MKRVIFVILVGLLLYNPLFSQNLGGGIWQLQNPDNPSNSEMVGFNLDSATFCYSTANLVNMTNFSQRGSFKKLGNYITLTFNNNQGSTRFFMTWIGPNKLVLSTSNRNLIFASFGSYEDQFFANYVNGIYSTGTYSGGGSYGGGSYGGSSGGGTSTGSTICYTCQGVGSCKVCGGTGVYRIYGQSSVCSACGGNGKCWHCHGSGKQ